MTKQEFTKNGLVGIQKFLLYALNSLEEEYRVLNQIVKNDEYSLRTINSDIREFRLRFIQLEISVYKALLEKIDSYLKRTKIDEELKKIKEKAGFNDW